MTESSAVKGSSDIEGGLGDEGGPAAVPATEATSSRKREPLDVILGRRVSDLGAERPPHKIRINPIKSEEDTGATSDADNGAASADGSASGGDTDGDDDVEGGESADNSTLEIPASERVLPGTSLGAELMSVLAFHDGACYRHLLDEKYDFEVCMFDEVRQREKKGTGTFSKKVYSLGKWVGYSDCSDFNEEDPEVYGDLDLTLHNYYRICLNFSGGDTCPGDVERSTLVSLGCGVTRSVYLVREPDMCKYQMRLDLPEMCPEATRVLQRIATQPVRLEGSTGWESFVGAAQFIVWIGLAYMLAIPLAWELAAEPLSGAFAAANEALGISYRPLHREKAKQLDDGGSEEVKLGFGVMYRPRKRRNRRRGGSAVGDKGVFWLEGAGLGLVAEEEGFYLPQKEPGDAIWPIARARECVSRARGRRGVLLGAGIVAAAAIAVLLLAGAAGGGPGGAKLDSAAMNSTEGVGPLGTETDGEGTVDPPGSATLTQLPEGVGPLDVERFLVHVDTNENGVLDISEIEVHFEGVQFAMQQQESDAYQAAIGRAYATLMPLGYAPPRATPRPLAPLTPLGAPTCPASLRGLLVTDAPQLLRLLHEEGAPSLGVESRGIPRFHPLFVGVDDEPDDISKEALDVRTGFADQDGDSVLTEREALRLLIPDVLPDARGAWWANIEFPKMAGESTDAHLGDYEAHLVKFHGVESEAAAALKLDHDKLWLPARLTAEQFAGFCARRWPNQRAAALLDAADRDGDAKGLSKFDVRDPASALAVYTAVDEWARVSGRRLAGDGASSQGRAVDATTNDPVEGQGGAGAGDDSDASGEDNDPEALQGVLAGKSAAA